MRTAIRYSTKKYGVLVSASLGTDLKYGVINKYWPSKEKMFYLSKHFYSNLGRK